MPEILTKRLALVPLTWPEKPMLALQAAWLRDPEVVKYSEQRHYKHTQASCKKYIQSFDHQTSHIWAIMEKNGAKSLMDHKEDFYMGNITAHVDQKNNVANLGIMIGERKFWGQGYGTEAWQGVSDWLLAQGVRKLEAGCMVSNVAMAKIFKTTGMSIEAIIKQHFILNGVPEDVIYYARFNK